MTDRIDQIMTLLNTKAEGLYGLSDVTQKQHALQCAHLAEQAGEPSEMIVAALVHDIGHMLHDIGEDFAERGVDDRHEVVSLAYLEDVFGPEVTAPVALHVEAKRYLCAAEPGYFDTLSVDSVKSLALQGGLMSPEEMREFESRPHWQAALTLRRFDDLGKSPDARTPPPEHFRRHLAACALVRARA